jgi:hypothetical protein
MSPYKNAVSDLKELVRKMGWDISQFFAEDSTDIEVTRFRARQNADLTTIGELMKLSLLQDNTAFSTSEMSLILISSCVPSRNQEQLELLKSTRSKFGDLARVAYAEVIPRLHQLVNDPQIRTPSLDVIVKHITEAKNARRDELAVADDYLAMVSNRIGKIELTKFYSRIGDADVANALVTAASVHNEMYIASKSTKPAPPSVLEGAAYLAEKALDLRSHLDPSQVATMTAIRSSWEDIQSLDETRKLQA